MVTLKICSLYAWSMLEFYLRLTRNKFKHWMLLTGATRGLGQAIQNLNEWEKRLSIKLKYVIFAILRKLYSRQAWDYDHHQDIQWFSFLHHFFWGL